MKLRALLLAALIPGACGPAAEKEKVAPPAAPEAAVPDAFGLHIEIGRYGAMLRQTGALTADRRAAAEADVESPRELARHLRESVWELNLERSRQCARGLFVEITCGSPYEPVWLSEPATVEPSLVDIQARSAAVGEEVGRLWDAACEDARSRARSRADRAAVCAIE